MHLHLYLWILLVKAKKKNEKVHINKSIISVLANRSDCYINKSIRGMDSMENLLFPKKS